MDKKRIFYHFNVSYRTTYVMSFEHDLSFNKPHSVFRKSYYCYCWFKPDKNIHSLFDGLTECRMRLVISVRYGLDYSIDWVLQRRGLLPA